MIECVYCDDDTCQFCVSQNTIKHEARSCLRELREWETGKRRVFWRVKWLIQGFGGVIGPNSVKIHTRLYARDFAKQIQKEAKRGSVKIYRVTVRPKRSACSVCGCIRFEEASQ